MFDRLSIRTKLIAIVAAPLVVILALASLGFTQRRVEAAETRGDVARLDTIETALDLSHEVQLEALQSVSFLASEGERSRAELTASRTRTDRAAAALESSLGGLADDASAVAAARTVLRQIDTLETSYRPQVDERDGEGTPTLEWQWAEQLYRTIQGSISPVSDRLVAAIDDRDVAAGARSAVALGLAVFVAASIARPLTSLTAAADRVASEQLPCLVEALRNPAGESEDHLRPEIEQLEVGGGRELARLTESVNSIQAVAVSVATEQATMLRKGIGDMFVNLAPERARRRAPARHRRPHVTDRPRHLLAVRQPVIVRRLAVLRAGLRRCVAAQPVIDPLAARVHQPERGRGPVRGRPCHRFAVDAGGGRAERALLRRGPLPGHR